MGRKDQKIKLLEHVGKYTTISKHAVFDIRSRLRGVKIDSSDLFGLFSDRIHLPISVLFKAQKVKNSRLLGLSFRYNTHLHKAVRFREYQSLKR